MAYAAGVCACADVDVRPRPVRAVAAEKVRILVPCEMGELVENSEGDTVLSLKSGDLDLHLGT